jgi:hypothetical protein
MMLPELDQFKAIVNQAIELEVDDQRLQAKVIEVKAMRRQHEGDREPFSVLIVTEEAEPLPQQIFRLHHQGLGTIDVFLVPIGPNGEGMAYEAVFT